MKFRYQDLKALSDEEFFDNPPIPGDCYEKAAMYPLEAKRRSMLYQHELNMELLRKQSETNKSFLRITVIATIVAAILGAVAGGFAQFVIPLFFRR